jgi:hypothetical protein
VIGDDPVGPVAESVDARAVHRSLSWFKSRPGLQPSLPARHSSKVEGGLRSFGWQASPVIPRKAKAGFASFGLASKPPRKAKAGFASFGLASKPQRRLASP